MPTKNICEYLMLKIGKSHKWSITVLFCKCSFAFFIHGTIYSSQERSTRDAIEKWKRDNLCWDPDFMNSKIKTMHLYSLIWLGHFKTQDRSYPRQVWAIRIWVADRGSGATELIVWTNFWVEGLILGLDLDQRVQTGRKFG